MTTPTHSATVSGNQNARKSTNPEIDELFAKHRKQRQLEDAAPELLAALQRILPDWNEEVWDSVEKLHHGDAAGEFSVGDILAARAAIAKATA